MTTTGTTTMERREGGLLERALRGNALFSAVSGAALLLASGPIAAWMGIGQPLVLAGTGAGLLGWAYLLWRGAGGPDQVALGRGAVAGDLAWVVGSVLILLAGRPELSRAGMWAVAGVADIVAIFALLQIIGLRRIRG